MNGHHFISTNITSLLLSTSAEMVITINIGITDIDFLSVIIIDERHANSYWPRYCHYNIIIIISQFVMLFFRCSKSCRLFIMPVFRPSAVYFQSIIAGEELKLPYMAGWTVERDFRQDIIIIDIVLLLFSLLIIIDVL